MLWLLIINIPKVVKVLVGGFAMHISGAEVGLGESLK